MVLLLNAVALHAQKENALLRLGNVAYTGQEFESADIAYRKAIELNTNRFESYFNLGNALYKKGNYAESEVKFNRAAQLAATNGEQGMCHYNRGNALLKQQKLEEAIEAYKSSLRAYPGYSDAQYNLSYAMNKLAEQQKGEQNQDDKQEKQDQEKENEEKDQDQKDQNKDQNQEGEKDQKNKDQQEKDGDQQDKGKDGKEQPKDEPKPGENPQSSPEPAEGIQKEEALQILEALKGEEKKVQAKILRQQGKGKKTKSEKEW